MITLMEALVPSSNRILYVDTYTKTLLDNALEITKANGDKTISRAISRIDEVEVVSVPTALLKTKYDFLTGSQSGFKPANDAENIAMILLHPTAILPVASYSFAQLEDPSALTQGKYVYFEESFEDVFILNNRHDAIQIVVKNA